MNWTAVAQAGVPVLTAVLGLIGFSARRTRLRSEIEANLKLLESINSSKSLLHSDEMRSWLSNRVALDVGRLAGLRLTNKSPIKWGSLVMAAIFALGFGIWAYYLNRDGYTWWSLPVIVAGALFGISCWGLIFNRELPPDEIEESNRSDGPIPSG